MLQVSEEQRLEALHSLHILDTEPEASYDELTRLAAELFDTPISLVTLLDEKRQWFKSRHGLDASETPRDAAFCNYTISSGDVFVVNDASEDERFCDNPLVTGEPHIRFYAGAPLKLEDGVNLGALCIIDSEPRNVDDNKLELLEIIRNAVVTQFKLRQLKSNVDEDALVTICAWCAKVQTFVDGGETKSWVSVNDYMRSRPDVTHGICPSCRDGMVKKP